MDSHAITSVIITQDAFEPMDCSVCVRWLLVNVRQCASAWLDAHWHRSLLLSLLIQSCNNIVATVRALHLATALKSNIFAVNISQVLHFACVDKRGGMLCFSSIADLFRVATNSRIRVQFCTMRCMAEFATLRSMSAT